MKKTSLVAFVALVLILIGLGYFAYLTSIQPAPLVVINSTTYICKGNKIIGAKFYLQTAEQPKVTITNEPPVPTGSVDITLSDGRSMHLAQTISGSGVRYANTDESFIFWTKGSGVIVLEDNEEKNYTDCEMRKNALPTSSTTTKKFLFDTEDFSIILPRYTTPPQLTRTDSYTVDLNHTYELVPGESITGVKFTIPSELSTGTNLSKDTYISVERITNAKKCSADMFFEENVSPTFISEKGHTFSVASTSGAAAGNRYEETVYATQGKSMCLAVRYFIHYSVFENYPKGSIKEFNKQTIQSTFDTIRKTLTVKG
jgi:membrane-bound inhibitor of C-type lysozyme